MVVRQIANKGCYHREESPDNKASDGEHGGTHVVGGNAVYIILEHWGGNAPAKIKDGQHR